MLKNYVLVIYLANHPIITVSHNKTFTAGKAVAEYKGLVEARLVASTQCCEPCDWLERNYTNIMTPPTRISPSNINYSWKSVC